MDQQQGVRAGVSTVIQEGDPLLKVAELSEELALYKRWVDSMLKVVEAAGRGDLEPRVIGCAGNDSNLGKLGTGINRLLDVTDAFVRESGAALEHAAAEKFYRELILKGMPGSFRLGATLINRASGIMATRSAEVKESVTKRLKLADDFENSVQGVIQNVATSVTQMRSTAESLARTSHESSDQANTVAAASEETSANVRTVAAAVEELTSSVSEITRQVTESAGIATNAVQEAKRTREIVVDLQTASTRIGSVAEMISKIAGTTNLLALNATIEAARAGDAGKGFAVVASEVKALALQTANATEEIGREIDAIRQKTSDVVDAITSIGTTIEKIDNISNTISMSVGEQRAATNEISSNVQQAAIATQQVSQSIIGVTAAVQETSTAATGLLGSSDLLSTEASKLRTVADSFVQIIRTGS
jgi:methyl-accepting chemotaxis protein